MANEKSRASRISLFLVVGFLAGQVLPLGCNPIAVFPDGSSDGTGVDVHIPTADAQPQSVELEGSCNRGEILVYERSGRAICAEIDELEFPNCDEGEVLTTRNRRLQCVGAENGDFDVEGLLPDCSSGKILVSQGFGRWRCEDR